MSSLGAGAVAAVPQAWRCGPDVRDPVGPEPSPLPPATEGCEIAPAHPQAEPSQVKSSQVEPLIHKLSQFWHLAACRDDTGTHISHRCGLWLQISLWPVAGALWQPGVHGIACTPCHGAARSSRWTTCARVNRSTRSLNRTGLQSWALTEPRGESRDDLRGRCVTLPPRCHRCPGRCHRGRSAAPY